MSSQTVSRRTVRCSHCREPGHNKRSCPSKHVTMRSALRCENMQKRKENTKKKLSIIKKEEKQRKENKEKEVCLCPICFDECGKHTTTLECGHTFDTKCIFKWLNKNTTCPCCRANVDELCKEDGPIVLPDIGIVPAIYRTCVEQAGERFTGLPPSIQMEAWYMMFKIRIETLSRTEYDELLNLELELE